MINLKNKISIGEIASNKILVDMKVVPQIKIVITAKKMSVNLFFCIHKNPLYANKISFVHL